MLVQECWQRFCLPKEDAWASGLRQMGFFLGKFVYLMDA